MIEDPEIDYLQNEGRLVVGRGAEAYEVFDVEPGEYAALQVAPDRRENLGSLRRRHEHRDCWEGLSEVLEQAGDVLLIDGDVNPRSVGPDGDTPLHVACVWGDLGAVELLLQSGADPNAVGDLGTTPLYQAVSFGHVRCAAALLAAGADPDAGNELKTTPRERASRSTARMQALFQVAR